MIGSHILKTIKIFQDFLKYFVNFAILNFEVNLGLKEKSFFVSIFNSSMMAIQNLKRNEDNSC